MAGASKLMLTWTLATITLNCQWMRSRSRDVHWQLMFFAVGDRSLNLAGTVSQQRDRQCHSEEFNTNFTELLGNFSLQAFVCGIAPTQGALISMAWLSAATVASDTALHKSQWRGDTAVPVDNDVGISIDEFIACSSDMFGHQQFLREI